MHLTPKQHHDLWSEGGPYSQAQLTIESRILDDKESRAFVIVETRINPLTYKIVKQNLKKFEKDELIKFIITNAESWGPKFGYVAYTFRNEYRDESVMEEARACFEDTKKAIIRMHKFAMDVLEINNES